MLLWLMARPRLDGILAFCLGPFGSTAVFAALTGGLVYRFGWFGMGMAGLTGLLVATRLSEGENGTTHVPGSHLRLRNLNMWQRGHAERHSRNEKRSDNHHLVCAASLAMIAIGFVMFVRHQI